MSTKVEHFTFKGGPLDGKQGPLLRAENNQAAPRFCKTIDGAQHWYKPTADGLMIYEGRRDE